MYAIAAVARFFRGVRCDRATDDREQPMQAIRAGEIGGEAFGTAMQTAEGESPEQTAENDADDVVPIEEREGITGGHFAGVCP